MGCSLNNLKSNHLLAPLTSTPIMGTKISNANSSIEIGTTNFFNKEDSTAENRNIIKSAKIVKNKCFEKKK